MLICISLVAQPRNGSRASKIHKMKGRKRMSEESTCLFAKYRHPASNAAAPSMEPQSEAKFRGALD